MLLIKALFLLVLVTALIFLGMRKVKRLSGQTRPHSLPVYYGIYLALTTGVPVLVGMVGCRIIDCTQVHLTESVTLYPVMVFFFGLAGFSYGWQRMNPTYPILKRLETLTKWGLFSAAAFSILVTFSIVLSMIFEALKFFQHVPVIDFLLGTEWFPYTLSHEHVGEYGSLPLFAGTFLIMLIAMAVAVPLGLFSAIYLSQYASISFRNSVKPILEVLAGIPTVVYGFFAVAAVSPLITKAGAFLGLQTSSESALAAGLVMGFMILPFISSLSDDVISAVPQSLKDGSLGMGATLSETICRVILPAASPGIVAAILMSISRAIGETMLVLMAIGLTANMTLNPLQSVTTVTVQIVSLLTGDQSFDSPAPLSAFALGLMLFMITFVLNMIALKVIRSYRRKYEF